MAVVVFLTQIVISPVGLRTEQAARIISKQFAPCFGIKGVQWSTVGSNVNHGCAVFRLLLKFFERDSLLDVRHAVPPRGD